MKALTRAAFLSLAGMALVLGSSADARRTPVRSNHVWNDIVQLERDVNRADTKDTISEREAAGMRNQIADLKADYYRLNRNGLSPAQANALESRVNTLRGRLHNEKYDVDHHRG